MRNLFRTNSLAISILVAPARVDEDLPLGVRQALGALVVDFSQDVIYLRLGGGFNDTRRRRAVNSNRTAWSEPLFDLRDAQARNKPLQSDVGFPVYEAERQTAEVGCMRDTRIHRLTRQC